MRSNQITSPLAALFVLSFAACVSSADPATSDTGAPSVDEQPSAAQGSTQNGTQPVAPTSVNATRTSSSKSGSAGASSNQGVGGDAGSGNAEGGGAGSGDAGSGDPGSGGGTGGGGGGGSGGTGGSGGSGPADAGTGGAADSSTTTTVSPIDDPGPKPTAACPVTKDSSGFFTRATTSSSYVGYLPPGYDGSKPVRLVVALHGCGDNAYNFATWGANPYDGRATQKHIGISVDGASGGGGCWSMGVDDAKVLAAIDDAMSCFWVHKHEVVLAGFSSGGELAYRVALTHASRFSGLLIESSAAYDSSSNEAALIAGASWKFPIAHVQHSSDTVFPLASVQSDWAKLTAAGFPLQTQVTAGGHDGTSADWAGWLDPKMASWLSP